MRVSSNVRDFFDSGIQDMTYVQKQVAGEVSIAPGAVSHLVIVARVYTGVADTR